MLSYFIIKIIINKDFLNHPKRKLNAHASSTEYTYVLSWKKYKFFVYILRCFTVLKLLSKLQFNFKRFSWFNVDWRLRCDKKSLDFIEYVRTCRKYNHVLKISKILDKDVPPTFVDNSFRVNWIQMFMSAILCCKKITSGIFAIIITFYE